jgi:hypothetical protein
MDFIDRLAGILRSLMGDRNEDTPGRAGGRTGGPGGSSGGPGGSPEGAGQGYRDPDLRAAWEELEEYMRGGSGGGSAGRTGTTGTGSSGGRYRRPEPPVEESLRKDFANLEVPFGADIETVRKSYKALVLRYHPDKFAGDPEKQRVALEITKKINESFERIRNRQ